MMLSRQSVHRAQFDISAYSNGCVLRCDVFWTFVDRLFFGTISSLERTSTISFCRRNVTTACRGGTLTPCEIGLRD